MEPETQKDRLVHRAYWLIKLRWIAIACLGTGTYISGRVLAIELQSLALEIEVLPADQPGDTGD